MAVKIDSQAKFLQAIREWNSEYGEYPKEFPVTIEESAGLLCKHDYNKSILKYKLHNGHLHLFGVKLTLYEEEGA